MYTVLHDILEDKKGGEIFKLFSGWHFFYILLAVLTVTAVLVKYRNEQGQKRQKVTCFFINLAFGMYVLDFFLMPIAYGEIDIEKLPFHACTAMCVMCFLSYRIEFLKKYRMSFVKLGFISNFVYLIYPAGVMWHGVHPLSYRVIQTLLFHCVMTVYGFLMLTYECEKKDVFNYRNDIAVIIAMTLWALLGNYSYNGTAGEYSHFFNWFFVVQDPFNMLEKTVAPYVMPFINVVLFSAVEMIINLILKIFKEKK